MIIYEAQSRLTKVWQPLDVSWEALRERFSAVRRTEETLEQYNKMTPDERGRVKDVGGYVGGRLLDGRRKAANVLGRCLLVLDADAAPEGFREAVTAFACPWACCAHTTHSHTRERPRWRLILPMTREVNADEYEAVARWLAGEIGWEYFDGTTFEPARLMYWPSCPSDGVFDFWAQDGETLNPDEILSYYSDWRDVTQWPGGGVKAAHGAKQGDPREKPGIVGAFCRVYDVPAAIARYLPEVYRDEGEGRYTYTGGTTAKGMILFDDGLFCRSYHATDPAGGHLVNAFDLVRLHLYGALDEDTDETVDVQNRPSYAAMRALCRDDAAVFEELGGSAAEDFRDDPDDEGEGLSSRGLGSDQDLALEFRDFAWPILRYSESLGWIAWDGMTWNTDAAPSARKIAMTFNDTRLALANSEQDDKTRKQMLKKAVGLRSTGKINGLLVNAQALLSDRRSWDTDPWLLNTPGGIVDLRTGDMKAHDAGERMTAVTTVSPDKGECRMWKRFLGQVTAGDAGVEDYLQQVLGMALVGKVYSEGLLMVVGPGGNGKSTLFGACLRVLGGYGDTVRPELVVARPNGGEVFGVECLRGKRLCVMAETDENAAMSVSQLKKLSSRDTISANPKHRQPFSFEPSHTLILHTNHLPRINQFDAGTKRRIAIVRFPFTPKPNEIIVDLMDQLVSHEGGAILQWMIDGAKRYFENGCVLRVPESVRAATEEYIGSCDSVGAFLDDCCETGGALSCMGGALYERYRSWCQETGERYPKRARDLAQSLQDKGFEKKKTPKGSVWYGLNLISEFMT